MLKMLSLRRTALRLTTAWRIHTPLSLNNLGPEISKIKQDLHSQKLEEDALKK